MSAITLLAERKAAVQAIETPTLGSIGPDTGESFGIGVLEEVCAARVTDLVSIEAEGDLACARAPQYAQRLLSSRACIEMPPGVVCFGGDDRRRRRRRRHRRDRADR